MQTFERIQFQVGQRTLAYCGYYESPHIKVYQAEPGTKKMMAGLGSLIPLLGITEQLGRLTLVSDKTDQTKALGTMAIHVCDYCCRDNIQWPAHVELSESEKMGALRGLVVYTGELHACHRRYHQQRGDKATFVHSRLTALRGLVWHMQRYAGINLRTSMLVVLNEAWNKIAKETGGQAEL